MAASMDTTVSSRSTEFAQRSSIRAFRAGEYVLIVAEGTLPTPGHQADVEESPLKIFPQQYDLRQSRRPGFWPQFEVPYRCSGVFRYPQDQPAVTVHHQGGTDEVTIERLARELAAFAKAVAEGPQVDGQHEATGMSGRLSFDEAFADALANLPDVDLTHPDQLRSLQVTEIGGLFGGFAGFHHLFVRIRTNADESHTAGQSP
ncbi:hypothetical protein ACQI4L_00285 [Mycolicibacterium litorale]|uniref:hypothetical protein n=1 Tax=Mycolicibacterium litorale TaxID=758802 RepID=UPI003CF34A52